MPNPRLAIVADWLVTFGGAERVLAAMRTLWPDAPLYTTVAAPEKLGPLHSATIHTTSLQRWYRLLKRHQILLARMPRAIEEIDLTGFDVVLSSSHAVAKGIVPPSNAVHICYCHTPIRYAWEMEDQYLQDFRVPRLLRGYVKRKLKEIRRWDLSTSKRVDVFIANSTTTQERILRTYGRDSVVIPPPVDDRFFAVPLRGITSHTSHATSHKISPDSTLKTQDYFLAVGRFVPYKRFDLLIDAANRLGFSLWIAGSGQDEARLRAMAGPTVRFLGYVPEAELPRLYAGAEALLFPQFEDAGLVLLEGMACGTPAIAYREGGARDALIDGQTGIFLKEQTVESLEEAINLFRAASWDRRSIREQTRKFSLQSFTEHLQRVIDEAVERHRARRP